MAGDSRKDSIDAVLDAADRLVRSGLLSLSGHGNVSVLLPDRDAMLYTAAPTLHGLRRESVAVVRLDGEVVEGSLPPLSVGAANMHRVAYQERPDIGCVIHTHSPFATAFAVAARPIECWSEPLSIFGMSDGIPVVPYARRGSQDAMEKIREALLPGRRALLLQNHGVLAFGADTGAAVQVSVLLEEAAQLGVYASSIGEVVRMPPDP